MREIKFRAWSVEANRWLNITNEIGFVDNGDGLGLLILDCGDRVIFEQFTGTKDRNGKDIWECDIVTLRGGKKPRNQERPKYNTTVVYKDNMFTVENNISIYTDAFVLAMSEVIGNIHDNPELLGAK